MYTCISILLNVDEIFVGRWLPLGVLDAGFKRSNSVLLEVNDFGVVIGGDTYETEDDWHDPQATEEVKLLNPSGPYFSLWDLPYMLEPRTKHAAVAIPGISVNCQILHNVYIICVYFSRVIY